MAIGVLVLGESGSGKSFSTHNFNEDEVKVISVEKPILPFKNHFEVVRSNDVKQIIKELKNTNKKRIVIDDFQYILGLACMRRSLEKGWDKFSEMQYDYFQILDALKELPDDVIVYFMSHTETDENGNTKIKTIGKALDKYITIEGLFMIVLGTKVSDGNYYFTTQTNGKDTVKTPDGMFPSYAIDNDLKYVDEKIRNYYEIGEFLSDEDITEIDEKAKKVDIEPDDGKKKRRERKAAKEAPAEEEKPKRARKSREEVEEANAEAVANAGIEEAEGAESVPFDKVEKPEVEKLPRRTRKDRTAAETPEPEAQAEETETADATPARRERKARGQVEVAQTPADVDEVKAADAAPTRRRRRA